jgi:hypothetical protein
MGKRSVVALGWAGIVLLACARPTEPPAAAPQAPVVTASAVEVAESATVEVPPAPVAEVAPAPVPFEGLAVVHLTELVAQLNRVADELAEASAVRADYAAFVATHGLADSDALYRDYVRVKLVFESTRDGGLWHLRWDITNEQPNSEQIWRQWKRARAPEGEDVVPTAPGHDLLQRSGPRGRVAAQRLPRARSDPCGRLGPPRRQAGQLGGRECGRP